MAYHDNSIIDTDDSPIESYSLDPSVNKAVDPEVKRKIEYKTDTSNYDPTEYGIVSPEKAQAEWEASRIKAEQELTREYADPVLAQAVKNIEGKLKRKITYDEFDRLCKTYAATLADLDANHTGGSVNPIDYKTYYNQLIQNRRVKPAYQVYAERAERERVDEIFDLLQEHQKYNTSELHIDKGQPINIRHQGKVAIKDKAHNREIIINNKEDVELLQARYRKDWIDKHLQKQKEDILREGTHDDDGWE